MINIVAKYITGELTPEEKKLFLLSVTEDKTLRNELAEFDRLLGHLSLLPQKEDDLKAQRSFENFLKEIDTKKNANKNV